MIEFLGEIAARVGWAIPVAILAWILARRFTHLEPRSLASMPGARPAWQRAIVLVLVAIGLWAGLVAVGWLLTEALDPVRKLDVAIIDWFAEHRMDAATAVAVIVDHIGDTPGIVAVLLIAGAIAHATTRRWAPALVLVVAAAGETAIFLAVQSVISRGRPEVEHLAVEPATSSFPSGHVAATFATYGCIALLMLAWSRGPLRTVAVVAAIVLPIAVAWSRMYQGMHHPSDVLTSLLFAPLWLAACWWAFRPAPRGQSVRLGRAPASEHEVQQQQEVPA